MITIHEYQVFLIRFVIRFINIFCFFPSAPKPGYKPSKHRLQYPDYGVRQIHLH